MGVFQLSETGFSFELAACLIKKALVAPLGHLIVCSDVLEVSIKSVCHFLLNSPNVVCPLYKSGTVLIKSICRSTEILVGLRLTQSDRASIQSAIACFCWSSGLVLSVSILDFVTSCPSSVTWFAIEENLASLFNPFKHCEVLSWPSAKEWQEINIKTTNNIILIISFF